MLSLFSSSYGFSSGFGTLLFYLFSNILLEAALIFGASVSLRASSFNSFSFFACFWRFLSIKFFYSYKNLCSRSSARFCSSSICLGRSFIGVASTVTLRAVPGFFFLVTNWGVKVHPCNSFSSRSFCASFSLFSYLALRLSISCWTFERFTFFWPSIARV